MLLLPLVESYAYHSLQKAALHPSPTGDHGQGYRSNKSKGFKNPVVLTESPLPRQG